jgi:hypothetical protein
MNNTLTHFKGTNYELKAFLLSKGYLEGHYGVAYECRKCYDEKVVSSYVCAPQYISEDGHTAEILECFTCNSITFFILNPSEEEALGCSGCGSSSGSGCGSCKGCGH